MPAYPAKAGSAELVDYQNESPVMPEPGNIRTGWRIKHNTPNSVEERQRCCQPDSRQGLALIYGAPAALSIATTADWRRLGRRRGSQLHPHIGQIDLGTLQIIGHDQGVIGEQAEA